MNPISTETLATSNHNCLTSSSSKSQGSGEKLPIRKKEKEMIMQRGKFIVLEGLDRSGKSSTVKTIMKVLSALLP